MTRGGRLAALALGFLLEVAVAGAETFEGHVIYVADGDTITVLRGKEQIRVRIAGIDAPERRQPHATRSLQHLSGLVRRRIVTVNWYKKDRYGRLVGTVRLRDVDIGFEQIQAGLAWHYKRYEHEQAPEDRARYAAAENEARAKQRGLWQDKEPVPPWEWRSKQK